MICHFLPLVFISFFIQPTTYKNVVKYFDARWLMTIRRQCTYSCMLFEHTNRTRHKNTLVATPLLSRAVPLGRCLLGRIARNVQEEQRNLRQKRAEGASFSFSRGADRANFACPKSPKIFTVASTLSYSSERATIFAASRAVSGCVYGCFVSLIPPLCSCILLSYSSFCIAYRSRIDRQQCLCSNSRSYVVAGKTLTRETRQSISLLKIR